jgi:predicted nucleotidyltransferase
MLPLIEQHRQELNQLCKRYDVRQLELFGSGARNDFDPASSDLDFLVAFRRDGTMSPADRYLRLLGDLEALFGRKVDLVEVSAHRNPYFMTNALKHRELLYAA